MYLCIYVYGIVKVEIYSHNKSKYFVYSSHITYYIPPKCAKTREPKDEHCVLQCIYIGKNICDPIPLEKFKNHTALQYITWGLIWDFKSKNERSQLLEFITRQSSGISKIRRKEKS